MSGYESKKNKQTSVRIPKDKYKLMQKVSEETGVTLNSIIVRMIILGMEFEKYCKENNIDIYREIIKREISDTGKAQNPPSSIRESEG